MKSFGGDVVVDTRRDPAFPRNAVYAAVGVQRLWFDSSPDTVRLTADGRGFVGLFGQTVLALRAQHVRAADPLPVFEQVLLGGDATLRGFELGYRSGDRLLAGSAEIRIPLSTPRRLTATRRGRLRRYGHGLRRWRPARRRHLGHRRRRRCLHTRPADRFAPRRRAWAGFGHARALHPGHDVLVRLTRPLQRSEPEEIATGPLTVEIRTTVGPLPSSTERP